MIQFVSCVEVVVTQRALINGLKIDVDLNKVYQNGLKVNISDTTEGLNDALGKA
jgi:hypothetical protein